MIKRLLKRIECLFFGHTWYPYGAYGPGVICHNCGKIDRT